VNSVTKERRATLPGRDEDEELDISLFKHTKIPKRGTAGTRFGVDDDDDLLDEAEPLKSGNLPHMIPSHGAAGAGTPAKYATPKNGYVEGYVRPGAILGAGTHTSHLVQQHTAVNKLHDEDAWEEDAWEEEVNEGNFNPNFKSKKLPGEDRWREEEWEDGPLKDEAGPKTTMGKAHTLLLRSRKTQMAGTSALSRGPNPRTNEAAAVNSWLRNQDFVGQNVDQVQASVAKKFPELKVQVHHVGDVVIMDHRLDRVRIFHNDAQLNDGATYDAPKVALTPKVG